MNKRDNIVATQVKSAINSVDLNFSYKLDKPDLNTGYPKTSILGNFPDTYLKNIVAIGSDNNISRLLFWLASPRGSYGRGELDKGGFIYSLPGAILNKNTLKNYEDTFRTAFNAEFSQDLKLLKCSMTADNSQKTIHLACLVQDLATQKISGFQGDIQR